jgi:carbamate kinase
MPVAVVAIGGNSLIKDTMHQSVRDQYIAARETCEHVVSMIADGWDVVVVHGNGPQVGFILRRSELAAHELHEVPLDACGADTQGALGYALQQNLHNELLRSGRRRTVVSLVTQVEVAADDPAFASPSKPIGSFLSAEEAERRCRQDGWQVVEDGDRGWRRVVPSPRPVRIVEEGAIRHLVAAGFVVVAVGGGGIPVLADAEGQLSGTAAVIDKDHSAALLAERLGAELLLISTSVERVALRYRQPDQIWLERLSAREARTYLAEGGHFGAGSMKPKIEAAVRYLEHGGRRVVITSPERIEDALAGRTGTVIMP